MARKELVLTFGMPLAAGLSLNQFAGALAHELGRFSQTAGARFAYMIRSVNLWFQRKVYEEDLWDEWIKRRGGRGDSRLAPLFMIGRKPRVVWIGFLPSPIIRNPFVVDKD